MLGAIIGDIVGSIYEWDNIKRKDFNFFNEECFFTDDSLMTVAVSLASLEYYSNRSESSFEKAVEREMRRLGRKYPNAGYGARFRVWLVNKDPKPYNSYGNGSAMRVSPVAWVSKSLKEAEKLAEISARVTHNHPEGIKGAKAVAGAIYMALNKKTKDEIKEYIEKNYYKLNFTLDKIRDSYEFDESCQGTVPQAIQAFLEAINFEDAVRNAVSLGGDSDTLAAICGSIAEAYYGIPEKIVRKSLAFLNLDITKAITCFREKVVFQSKFEEEEKPELDNQKIFKMILDVIK